MHPGEFEPADDASFPNKCLDEQRYISYLSTELKTLNFSNHAVTDTSRNAVQGLRQEWTEWCNVNGAGFGVRPTGVTGDALVDAFVWVKDGGESDGTSDVSSSGYDKACGIASGESYLCFAFAFI